nr:MAG TPA: hypothetical protein [Caudoviricetes sp.]
MGCGVRGNDNISVVYENFLHRSLYRFAEVDDGRLGFRLVAVWDKVHLVSNARGDCRRPILAFGSFCYRQSNYGVCYGFLYDKDCLCFNMEFELSIKQGSALGLRSVILSKSCRRRAAVAGEGNDEIPFTFGDEHVLFTGSQYDGFSGWEVDFH